MPVQCGYNTHFSQNYGSRFLLASKHVVFCLTLSFIAIMYRWLKSLRTFSNFVMVLLKSQNMYISYSAHVGRTSLAGRKSSRSRHQTQRGQCCTGQGRTGVGQDAGWDRGKGWSRHQVEHHLKTHGLAKGRLPQPGTRTTQSPLCSFCRGLVCDLQEIISVLRSALVFVLHKSAHLFTIYFTQLHIRYIYHRTVT